MDDSTRIILSRRFVELHRELEISDKNIDKMIEILATKTRRKAPEDIARNARIVDARTAYRKLRTEMIKGLRESMVRGMDAAVA